MGCSKNIIKILILVQLLACAFATDVHPDAELIDFRSPTQPSRDQMLIEAATKQGMDVEAVTELLHTRKPVVRTTTTPEGFIKTTTYKLEPDGKISRQSILTKRDRFFHNPNSTSDVLNTYTGTHVGSEKPRLADLDPKIQEILNRAGIVPELVEDSVAVNRTEPDGRVITTTYKVNTVSSTPLAATPIHHHYMPSQLPFEYYHVQLTRPKPKLTAVEEYLSRLGLSKFDIIFRNGIYTKTIGNSTDGILKVTFVYTSPFQLKMSGQQ